MLTDVAKALRPRVANKQSEHAVSRGRVTDRGAFRGRDPFRDELGEPLATRTEHAEGAVPGAHERARGADDPRQDVGQLETGRHRDDGVEQGTETGVGSAGRGGPLAELAEQAVEVTEQVVELDGPERRIRAGWSVGIDPRRLRVQAHVSDRTDRRCVQPSRGPSALPVRGLRTDGGGSPHRALAKEWT